MTNILKKKKKTDSEFSKKINTWQYRVILFLFIIAILFFVILVFTNIFNKKATYENIEEYIKKEGTEEIDQSKIVTNYSNFYTVQGIIEQFVNCLISEQYDEAYKVIDGEFLAKFKSKKECIEFIKNYTKNNFIIFETSQDYVNTNKLKKLYNLNTGDYLAQYINKNGDLIKIGVRIDSNKRTYSIFYLDI